MLEAIIGGVVAIALGVAANIITPHVENKLKIRLPDHPSKTENFEPNKNASDDELEVWRANNRRNAQLLFWKFYVFGASFFAMYLAVFLPLSWSAGISENSINLAGSRLGFDYTVTRDNFSTVATIFAMILYIPCWYVAQKIADLITSIAHRYGAVNEIKYGVFIALGMLFMALLVAGHMIFILNPSKSYIESVVLPFIVLLIVGIFASSRR
ncbi:hypothetical protein [Thalassotalea hakodatensis]|uniref:hypothetical protein n=1 Tax=Thalassotalea hakodatensis TaxID=3030492 RepID=UPI0025746EC3|nr:hypothetical protein [Thalassotalea hakodatensis]